MAYRTLLPCIFHIQVSSDNRIGSHIIQIMPRSNMINFEKVLAVRHNEQARPIYLIKWKGREISESTWETLTNSQFLDLQARSSYERHHKDYNKQQDGVIYLSRDGMFMVVLRPTLIVIPPKNNKATANYPIRLQKQRKAQSYRRLENESESHKISYATQKWANQKEIKNIIGLSRQAKIEQPKLENQPKQISRIVEDEEKKQQWRIIEHPLVQINSLKIKLEPSQINDKLKSPQIKQKESFPVAIFQRKKPRKTKYYPLLNQKRYKKKASKRKLASFNRKVENSTGSSSVRTKYIYKATNLISRESLRLKIKNQRQEREKREMACKIKLQQPKLLPIIDTLKEGSITGSQLLKSGQKILFKVPCFLEKKDSLTLAVTQIAKLNPQWLRAFFEARI